MFKPKPDVTAEERLALADALRRTCAGAPTVRRAFVGRVADLGAGYSGRFGDTTYDYVAVLEFDDRAGLMSYFDHPSHQDLAELFWQTCLSTAILDVEGGDAKSSDMSLLV